MEGAKQLGEWFSAVPRDHSVISQIFTVLAVPSPHLTTTERLIAWMRCRAREHNLKRDRCLSLRPDL